MLLSRLLAGFTRGQSDTLRKAMGKKMISKMNELKEKFIDGGSARGHKKDVLEKIWSEWEKFASYAFNKSHATCYSWVAFQTGYLKANYPAEYMAAVLTRNLNDIAKLRFYMDECRAMGIEVKGPDINESFGNFNVSSPGVIRFGLTAIKGIGPDVVKVILETRDSGGPFNDIYDFVERVPASSINRRVFDNLVLAGAFDCFTTIKREDLSAEVGKRGETIAELLLRYGASHQNEARQAEYSLFAFDDEEIRESSRPKIPAMPAWDNLSRLNKERELVGMYLSANPLDPYWLEVRYGVGYTAAEKNEIETPTQTVTFAGMINAVEERTLQSGSKMTIIKIEDYSGTTEITFFDKQRAEFDRLCKVGQAVYVIGAFREIRNRNTGAVSVRFNVDRMLDLNDLVGKLVDSITITVDPDQIMPLSDILDEEDLAFKAYKKKYDKSPGNTVPVNIDVYSSEHNRKIHFSSALHLPLSRKFLDDLDKQGIIFNINRKPLS